MIIFEKEKHDISVKDVNLAAGKNTVGFIMFVVTEYAFYSPDEILINAEDMRKILDKLDELNKGGE